MENAGFVRVEAVGNRVTLDKTRLRLYPLFTEEFLDWLFDQFGCASPIYTVHLRGIRPVQGG
ncbi:MAG: hypothetical protein QN163_01045 [Armatimonadota bacterium]|nr:hypothetical protein [Armatimonadota bacterium]MDR5697649.1 hypothetical protein [Armatimonadota bacterium]